MGLQNRSPIPLDYDPERKALLLGEPGAAAVIDSGSLVQAVLVVTNAVTTLQLDVDVELMGLGIEVDQVLAPGDSVLDKITAEELDQVIASGGTMTSPGKKIKAHLDNLRR